MIDMNSTKNPPLDTAVKVKHLKYLDSLCIFHTAFQNGLDALEEAFDSALAGCQAGCYIIAESRMGKSTLLDKFAELHPSIINEEGRYMPVVSLQCPPKATQKGLATMILRAFQDPFPASGTEQQLIMRVVRFLLGCETKVLCIDEIQHLVDKSKSYSIAHHASDFIKVIMNETGVVPVLSGLEYGQAVLNQNEALRGRISESIGLPRFNWKNTDQRDQFFGLLEACNDHYSHIFRLPDLTQEDFAYRLYLATGGLTGYLAKLLRNSAQKAMTRGSLEITSIDFIAGYNKTVTDFDRHKANPFADDFKLSDAGYLDAAKRIGTRSEEYGRKTGAYRPSSLREAMA